MGELRPQTGIALLVVYLIGGGGQRLQLGSGRSTRPAGIVQPEMLRPGNRILKINGRRQVHVIMYYLDPLGRIEAVKAGELHPRAHRKSILWILYPVIQREAVGMRNKPVGITEQTVEMLILKQGIDIIIGIIDRYIPLIVIIVVEFQDLVLAHRLRIGQGRADRIRMSGIHTILIEGIHSAKPV